MWADAQMPSRDIGVLPPLGVYDPLGLIETRDMRRYEIMASNYDTDEYNLVSENDEFTNRFVKRFNGSVPISRAVSFETTRTKTE